MLELLLIIVLIVMLVGAFPAMPYNRDWGYRPFGSVTLVIIIVIIILVWGRGRY